MREIEIKLKVNNLDELEKKLKEQGCVFFEAISQHDVIYSLNNIQNEFSKSKEGDIIIRIRRQNNIAELNLKKQLSYEMDNTEFETEIKDPEAVHQMLTILGWKQEVEVKKIRKKGKIGEYEICLDRVEELGSYIELEKLTNDSDDPNKVRKELFEILKPFELSEKDEEIKGYDTQIYQLHHSKN